MAPTISSNSPVCEGNAIQLTASNIPGATYNWTGPNGFTSTQQNPKILNATAAKAGKYTVTATVNGCTSEAATTNVVVNPIPLITGTTPASRCGPGTVNLGATFSAGTINWYSAATGGTILGTGTIFTTPNISSTTTYYVDATLNGCTTGSRTPVLATVNTVPTITGTTPGSRCGPGTVDLGATASAGTINWYAAPTGGTSLETGPNFTPNISSTTTYYVDATSNGCTTGSRTPVVATVNTVPTITGTTPGSRCGPGTVNLEATASAGTINWYESPTGGSSLGTGSTFTTPSISSNTTYYVDATSNGCTTGTRTAVLATVNSIPSAPLVNNNGPICVEGTLKLTASDIPGATYQWTGPNGFNSNQQNPEIPNMTAAKAGTYSVTATVNGCTSEAAKTTVSVNC